MKKYDYLIVGAGLFGSTFAYEMSKKGKKCIVIDKRDHIGGNVFTETLNDITIHKYGAHIFHTSDKTIWDYVTSLCQMNDFINSPIANYNGEMYHLPFNMNTFHEMWGISAPDEAKTIIEEQIKKEAITNPKNLEEQAISMVGRDIYEKLIKGYTEKQWGRNCNDLPVSIIKRIPVRFEYNNNYFNDAYQGIPTSGYTAIIEKMLSASDIRSGIDYKSFLSFAKSNDICFDKTLYTGMIDEYFDFKLGYLEYRSLRFDTSYYEDVDNYQNNAVINYTDRETPFTRIIEHKHFTFSSVQGTYITKEYPIEWTPGTEPYYPINNEKNALLYSQYLDLAQKEHNVIFGGRLGMYKYFDMDQCIKAALNLANSL